MTLSWWRGVHPLDPSRVPCYLAYLYVAIVIVCIDIFHHRRRETERHPPLHPPREIRVSRGRLCIDRWIDEGRLRTRARAGFKTTA